MSAAFLVGFRALWWASWVFVGAVLAIAAVTLIVFVVVAALEVVAERLGLT